MSADNELVDAVILETADKMDKAVEHTQVEFGSIRTGRSYRPADGRRGPGTRPMTPATS